MHCILLVFGCDIKWRFAWDCLAILFSGAMQNNELQGKYCKDTLLLSLTCRPLKDASGSWCFHAATQHCKQGETQIILDAECVRKAGQRETLALTQGSVMCWRRFRAVQLKRGLINRPGVVLGRHTYMKHPVWALLELRVSGPPPRREQTMAVLNVPLLHHHNDETHICHWAELHVCRTMSWGQREICPISQSSFFKKM